MKQGRTLTQLAQEIERQKAAKRDFVADTRQLRLGAFKEGENAHRVDLTIDGIGAFPLTPIAHGQIAERVGIPKRYYDRMMAEAPSLLEANVNHWFREQPEQRMIRTLDGHARAFLSNRYRRLDHAQLLEAALPTLAEFPDVEIVSCEVTEMRLYLKAVFPRLQADVRVGDPVQAGVVISNSEVGLGSVSVAPMIYRLVCLNGMTVPDRTLKKSHIGRALNADEDVAIFAEDTLEADDKAFFLKTRDVVRQAVNEVAFRATVQRLQEAGERKIEGDPVKAVEELANRSGLTDREQSSVLRHLIEGGDLSALGLINAVTRASQDVDDYDRASELETLGGKILELPSTNWREIAKAA